MPPAEESQNTRPDVMLDPISTEGVTPDDFVLENAKDVTPDDFVPEPVMPENAEGVTPDALVPEPHVPENVVPENVLPVKTEDVQQEGDQPVSEPVSCKSIIINVASC